MNKVDLIYKNTGRSLAHRIQQTAFSISRSNMARDGALPPLLSEQGKKLAANSAPRNAFEVVGVDDRQRMSIADDDPHRWRQFKPGDATPWDDPEEEDPNHKLFTTNERGEYEEEDPDLRRQIDGQEPHEGYDEPDDEEEAEENRELARTGNAFDKKRLYRAIDRLTRRTKKQFTKGRDGRSYARDDGRSYATAHGCIGGAAEWNAAFARGEVC